LDGLKKVLASFEQATPSVAVTMTVDNNDKLIAAVAAGTPPDTVELADSDVIQFGKRSALQPLDDRMAQQQLKNMYEPSQLAEVDWRGKSYGLPVLDNELLPFTLWNKNLLQQAGLPPDQPPATLAAMLDAAKRLTKLAPDGSITQLGWEPLAEVGGNFLDYWAPAYGVTWFDAGKQQINLIQPGLLSALDYLKAAYQELGLTPDLLKAFRAKYPQWNAAKGGTAQGVEAMKISSSVSVGTLAHNAPGVPIGTGWAPPAQEGRTFVTLGGGGNRSVCLPVGAARPDAAFIFMRYLATPAASQVVFDEIGWLNYNTVVAQQLNISQVPSMHFILEAAQKAQTVVTTPILPIDTSSVAKGVAAVIAGQQSAQDMLTQVTRQLQGALDQANTAT